MHILRHGAASTRRCRYVSNNLFVCVSVCVSLQLHVNEEETTPNWTFARSPIHRGDPRVMLNRPDSRPDLCDWSACLPVAFVPGICAFCKGKAKQTVE